MAGTIYGFEKEPLGAESSKVKGDNHSGQDQNKGPGRIEEDPQPVPMDHGAQIENNRELRGDNG